jgi:hypothetical protein
MKIVITETQHWDLGDNDLDTTNVVGLEAVAHAVETIKNRRAARVTIQMEFNAQDGDRRGETNGHLPQSAEIQTMGNRDGRSH